MNILVSWITTQMRLDGDTCPNAILRPGCITRYDCPYYHSGLWIRYRTQDNWISVVVTICVVLMRIVRIVVDFHFRYHNVVFFLVTRFWKDFDHHANLFSTYTYDKKYLISFRTRSSLTTCPLQHPFSSHYENVNVFRVTGSRTSDIWVEWSISVMRMTESAKAAWYLHLCCTCRTWSTVIFAKRRTWTWCVRSCFRFFFSYTFVLWNPVGRRAPLTGPTWLA